MSAQGFLVSRKAGSIASGLLRRAKDSDRLTEFEHGPALLEPWEDFDSIYLALQNLWLLKESVRTGWYKKRIDLAAANGSSMHDRDGAKVVVVEFLLDMELGLPAAPGTVSEYAVITLMNFRRAFENILDFDSSLVSIDVGCVLLVFHVIVPNPQAELLRYAAERPNSGAPTAPQTPGEAAVKAVDEQLSSGAWSEIKTRFDVRETVVRIL